MNVKRFFWPAVGLAAVAFSLWVLFKELRGISLDDVWTSLATIRWNHWLLAALSSIVAYAALAGYDHIALLHLRKRVSWLFVTLCSFTTYALSHNIGGSVFSGAVIRYRAYGTKGLSGQDVGVLVAVCWITFVLSSILLGGIVLILIPDLFERFSDIRSFTEFLSAGAILYFALPVENNPAYLVVFGIFLVAFSLAQISHAPGGLGVFEVVFLAGLQHMDQAGVIAALLVFRMFYLIIPLILALIVVLVFERSQFGRAAN